MLVEESAREARPSISRSVRRLRNPTKSSCAQAGFARSEIDACPADAQLNLDGREALGQRHPGAIQFRVGVASRECVGIEVRDELDAEPIA